MFTDRQCPISNEYYDVCWGCRKLLCDKCDELYSRFIDYDTDVAYCKKCKPIEICDLYNYMKNKYGELLTLKEIQNIINEN